MIVLITSPENRNREATFWNEAMAQFPILLHLRKPNYLPAEYEALLLQIDSHFRDRIVLHQHHQLAKKYAVKGVHLTENNRKNTVFDMSNAISTSFHNLEDAKNNIASYEYAFCSPVFQSISKTAYFPSENWHLEKTILKEKAVALGGVEVKQFSNLRKRGFKHIALMGAVWQAKNPILALKKCCELW